MFTFSLKLERSHHGLVERDNSDCKENDPAARSLLEVLLTYPGIKALAAHQFLTFFGIMVVNS